MFKSDYIENNKEGIPVVKGSKLEVWRLLEEIAIAHDTREISDDFPVDYETVKKLLFDIAGMFNESVLEDKLGRLAMLYRGNRIDRQEIVKEYEEVVQKLINTGQWKETPDVEDQLPTDVMPKVFFEYWEKFNKEKK
jgi:hypothetical protein